VIAGLIGFFFAWWFYIAAQNAEEACRLARCDYKLLSGNTSWTNCTPPSLSGPSFDFRQVCGALWMRV